MKRPEKVSDAISKEGDEISVGHYGPYVLRSAYQPIFFIEHDCEGLLGVEALIRPELNLTPISPVQFFSNVDMEDNFFVEWMCRALHMRNFKSLERPDIDLYINLNPAMYTDVGKTKFELDFMVSKMAEINLPTSCFVCEIVESKAVSNNILHEMVQHLRHHNIRIAIDDFGADHSNMERVRSVQPDCVKLDRAWTKRFMNEPATYRLLETIVRGFRDDSIEVIFEGTETFQELSFARELGGTAAQGFYFCKPQLVPIDAKILTNILSVTPTEIQRPYSGIK